MPHRTEGHRLLAESGKTQAEVVRAVQRSAPTVFRWFRGGKPDVDSANLLAAVLGIPATAWSEKPKRRSGGKRKAA